jgi:hypothetical protein
MDELWRRLDPALWALTYHPSVVLQTVSRERLASALAEPDFPPVARPPGAGQASRQLADTSPGSTEISRGFPPESCVAYFCMEFMLSEALPDLFGRARQRGRRPAQGRQRPGGAGGRRGPALPAGLFPPGDRPGRSPAGALSLQRSRTTASPRRCVSRTASGCAWRSPCRDTPCGCAPGRSRSAGQSSICSTPMTRPTFPCSSGNHQRTVWRRPGTAPQAGNGARDRRLAAARPRSGSNRTSAI